jgi:ureidoacrylate peracid hydrolase
MFALSGIDIAGIRAAVEPTRQTLEAARRAGLTVVYLKMGFLPDLSNAGGPEAPNLIKHQQLPFPVGTTMTVPDGSEGRILIRDTWGTDIVAELAPQPGDLEVWKHRFSGFFETELHEVLAARSITTLVFTGCTTSICVESTVRDAMFRDFRCLVLEDCTAEPIGEGLPRSNHDASLLVMEALFGWVSQSGVLIGALGGEPVAVAAPA